MSNTSMKLKHDEGGINPSSPTFDQNNPVVIAAKLQEVYCHEHHTPMFAPPDGVCFSCGCSIYKGERGYSFATSAGMLITDCPYCHTSFCG